MCWAVELIAYQLFKFFLLEDLAINDDINGKWDETG